MKKWWKEVPVFNGILCAFYTAMVMTAGWYMSGQQSRKKLLLAFVLLVVLLMGVWPVIFQCGQRFLNLHGKEKQSSQVSRAFVFFTIITFVLLLVWYVGYFPGLFSPDSMAQLEQAESNAYTDWHPVLHTLLVFKIPLLLTRGWIGSIVLIQIGFFSIAMGYAFSCLYQFTGLLFSGISLGWILLNPITGNMLLYPWKDVTFAGFAMVLIAMALNVVATDGEWLEKKKNIVLFPMIAAVCTILRHNAILFTLPVILGGVLYAKHIRKKAVIVVLCAGMIFAVKGPLYASLHVEKPDQRTVETVGLPMTVIGSAVSAEPEKLDAEILDFAYQVATPENWKEYYQCGNFNAIKWQSDTNLDAIDEKSPAELVGMMMRCFVQAPFSSSQALLTLIGFIVIPTQRFNWPDRMYLGTATASLPVEGNSVLVGTIEKYAGVIGESPLYYMFANIGCMTLLMALLVVMRCSLTRARNWKRILIAGAILVYNWGTMLLLTGFDLRFFFVTILVVPFVIAIVCRETAENRNGE